MKNQPTPELEAENAAYVWVKECLAEHINDCRQAAEYMTEERWENIAWTFERLRLAQERHRAMEKARLGK